MRRRDAGGDVTKLPKWAQSYIEWLEREIGYTEQRVGALLPDALETTDTVLADAVNGDAPLPDGATIEFAVGAGDIQVRAVRKGQYEDGPYLQVMAINGDLHIQPRAGNVISITLPNARQSWRRLRKLTPKTFTKERS